MIRSSGESAASLTRQQREQQALLSARSLVDRMRALYRELEQRSGAPISAHRALACIESDPGIPASRLAATLGMRRPAVSHLLRNLVANGWIKRLRSEADQRSVRLTITASGRQVIGATSGRVVGTLQRAVRDLNERDLENLEQGLRALLGRLPEPKPQGGLRAGVVKPPTRGSKATVRGRID